MTCQFSTTMSCAVSVGVLQAPRGEGGGVVAGPGDSGHTPEFPPLRWESSGPVGVPVCAPKLALKGGGALGVGVGFREPVNVVVAVAKDSLHLWGSKW